MQFVSILFFLINDNNDHDALESLIQKYDGELLQRTLEQSLSSCSDNLLDEKIFNEIFPFAHDLLFKVKEQKIHYFNIYHFNTMNLTNFFTFFFFLIFVRRL